MRIVLFSKFLKELDVPGLVQTGERLGLEGWDLCVRPGYPVNPDNVATSLPAAARQLEAAGQPVAMVTGNFDVLLPDAPNAEPLSCDAAAPGRAG